VCARWCTRASVFVRARVPCVYVRHARVLTFMLRSTCARATERVCVCVQYLWVCLCIRDAVRACLSVYTCARVRVCVRAVFACKTIVDTPTRSVPLMRVSTCLCVCVCTYPCMSAYVFARACVPSMCVRSHCIHIAIIRSYVCARLWALMLECEISVPPCASVHDACVRSVRHSKARHTLRVSVLVTGG
jgi:hypothetical protein